VRILFWYLHLFEELEKLDLIELSRSGIGIFDPETKDCEPVGLGVISPKGQSWKTRTRSGLPFTIHPMLVKGLFDAWLGKKKGLFLYVLAKTRSFARFITVSSHPVTFISIQDARLETRDGLTQKNMLQLITTFCELGGAGDGVLYFCCQWAPGIDNENRSGAFALKVFIRNLHPFPRTSQKAKRRSETKKIKNALEKRVLSQGSSPMSISRLSLTEGNSDSKRTVPKSWK